MIDPKHDNILSRYSHAYFSSKRKRVVEFCSTSRSASHAARQKCCLVLSCASLVPFKLYKAFCGLNPPAKSRWIFNFALYAVSCHFYFSLLFSLNLIYQKYIARNLQRLCNLPAGLLRMFALRNSFVIVGASERSRGSV